MKAAVPNMANPLSGTTPAPAALMSRPESYVTRRPTQTRNLKYEIERQEQERHRQEMERQRQQQQQQQGAVSSSSADGTQIEALHQHMR